MAEQKILIRENSTAGCRVRLPNVKGGHLQLWVGGHLRLPASVPIEPCEDEKAVLLADQQTLRRLTLRPGQSLAFMQKEKILRLGPVVGILTAGQGTVPGNRQMFRYVLEACRQAGLIAYVFLPGQVNWPLGLAQGYQWGNGRWILGRFPAPDVVYNRVPTRQLEHSLAVTSLKSLLRRRGIPYFNPRYLNKLDLHRILSREASAVPYLPWTGRVKGLADVDHALRRFGSVYLKPKDAFAGKGILRVSSGKNGYQVRFRVNNVNRKVGFESVAQLHAGLRQMMDKDIYIVQQAIELARYRGRIFDVRLLTQKNHQGKWQVSGMGVRVASQGGITTHVPNGGYIASISQVLPEVFRGRAEEVEQAARGLALRIAPMVEKGCRESFGELSMDIGIDENGHPFFFEANAKPMKFDEDRIRKVGLGNLVGYMQYLTFGEGVNVNG